MENFLHAVVTYSNRCVVATTQQHGSREEIQAPYSFAVAFQRHQTVTCPYVPDLNRFVQTACTQNETVKVMRMSR